MRANLIGLAPGTVMVGVYVPIACPYGCELVGDYRMQTVKPEHGPAYEVRMPVACSHGHWEIIVTLGRGRP